MNTSIMTNVNDHDLTMTFDIAQLEFLTSIVPNGNSSFVARWISTMEKLALTPTEISELGISFKPPDIITWRPTPGGVVPIVSRTLKQSSFDLIKAVLSDPGMNMPATKLTHSVLSKFKVI